jgi:GPH family glycoside/pentoside/hexuronide:cation symporter
MTDRRSTDRFSHINSAGAGLLGLPLAFVALPVYVHLPHWYATHFGVPLTVLGLVLLFSRLTDAVIDPWLGRLSDRLYARSIRSVLGASAGVALALALGFVGLFFPPTWVLNVPGHERLLVWAALMLTLSHCTYSALGIMHQSWAAMLGGTAVQRSRLIAWREGLALLGVMLASALPSLIGMNLTALFLVVALALGWMVWSRGVWPQTRPAASVWTLTLPWRFSEFRRLLTVFLLNGVASAVPATLVMFFVQDQIQAPVAQQPWFLALYFLAGALSLPAWLRCIARWGLPRAWLAGMGLSVVAFLGVGALSAGDSVWFLLACGLSGLALGADLAVPGAMLNGLIERLGYRGQAEGAFMGWWNLATKLNLALAAGCALPLLSLWGYAPGSQAPQALWALTLAYVVLPCTLKVCAAVGVYFFFIRQRGWV